MDFELQRRMDGAVHKCFGEQRNTVIEIHKMYSTPLIARSRRVAGLWLLQWQTATKPPRSARYTGRWPSIASLAQESASLASTPSRRRLRGPADEEGIFYVTAWSLSGTRTLRAGRRSSALRVQYGRVTSLRLGEKANGAMKAQMLGLPGSDCPLAQARGPSKWDEMHWNPGHRLLQQYQAVV
jgi:hypothetical protein